MDVRRLTLEPRARRARALVADAAGVREVELAGEAGERVSVAATALLAWVAGRVGEPPSRLDAELSARRATAERPDGSAVELALRDPSDDAALASAIAAAARGVTLELRPARPLPELTLDERFWSAVYRTGRDGWELARAAPPLVRWVAEHPCAGQRVLVVGCGRGHEARLLAAAGAQVTAIDLVDAAVAEARAQSEREGLEIDWRVGDLFDLPAGPDRFDRVLEHCCYCAIDPRRRGEYVDAMADVLVEGGELVGLFWAHGRPGGPPFAVDREDLLATFAVRFAVRTLEVPTDSVPTRAGQELLATFTRRPGPPRAR